MLDVVADPSLVAQIDPNQLTENLGTGLDAKTLAAGNAVAQTVATSDWLGPLAPIALSPFFGLAALSGAATYGPDWLQERSALFSEASPLNNPVLFWTMVGLAILTSLPRLTKVSKPIALVAENLEAYSAIVILIVVRFVGMSSSDPSMGDPSVETAALQPVVLSAGLASMPVDLVMSLVAALNVIVINVVKLFFEFLVWLIPFPSVDAILEASNKALCAALMGIYMYSPLIATILNLILLAVCMLVFGWCYRRLTYYREIVGGPLLAWLLPNWFAQKGNEFRAFCSEPFDGLPAYSSLRVSEQSDSTYLIRGRWLWKSASVTLSNCRISRDPGLIIQKINLTNENGTTTLLHRRWIRNDENYVPDPNSPNSDAPVIANAS